MVCFVETESEEKMNETILDNTMQIRLLNKQIKKLSLSKTLCCEEVNNWARKLQQIIEQAGEDLLLELNENFTSLEVPMDQENIKIDGSMFPGNMKFVPNLDLQKCLGKAGLGVILSGNVKTDFIFQHPQELSSNVVKQECNYFNKAVINEDFIESSQLGQNLEEKYVVKQTLVDYPPLVQNPTRSSLKGEAGTPLKISSSLILQKLDPPKQNPGSIEFPIEQNSIPRSNIVRKSDADGKKVGGSNLFLRTINSAVSHKKTLDKQMMKKNSVVHCQETFEKTHQNNDVNVRDIEEHIDIVLNNALKVDNINLLNNNDCVYSQSSPKKEEMENKSRNWFKIMKSIRQSRGSPSRTNVSLLHPDSVLSLVRYDNLNVSVIVNNSSDPTGSVDNGKEAPVVSDIVKDTFGDVPDEEIISNYIGDDQIEIPRELRCNLCDKLSRRAMRLVCDRTVVCWSCAVKEINKKHVCWKCGEVKIKTTNHLVKDESLRIVVDEFKKKIVNPAFLHCPRNSIVYGGC